MPMHPAAPTELSGLVDAYGQTLQAVVDLTFACSDELFARPTDCPGWTLKDQVSHLVDTEAQLAGRPAAPPVNVPDYAHLHTDLARALEQGVELRRPRPACEVVEELQAVVAERLEQLKELRERDDDLDATTVAMPWGETSLRTALTARISDLWVHEQDIRAALGRPGALDTPGAAIFTEAVLDALPAVVVERVGLEPGKVVMIELTGPVVARSGVRVERDDDGTAVAKPMFSGNPDETGPIPAIGKTTSIRLSTDAFTRRAAGRRTTEEITYSVLGDEQVAKAVLDHLVVTP